MEGKAKNKLLEHQATDPKTARLFAHLRKDGRWIVRDDVYIKFLERHGGLTIGYGSRDRTGLELEFGTVMGDHFDEPVLLIKAAWGGRAIYRRFRPPSAGMPDEAYLQNELEKKQANVRKRNEKKNRNDPLPTMEQIKAPFGEAYRDMIAEVRGVMKDHASLFPRLKGRELELAGFVWFQGWNDMVSERGRSEYASNMAHLIRDVRKDLDAPNMPVVIGAMGQNGSKEAGGSMAEIVEAQFAVAKLPEFKGTVRTIRTDVLVDKAAEELYPKWKQHFEQWEKTGSDFGYHYMGSAIWFNRIGKALAEEMLDVMGEK